MSRTLPAKSFRLFSSGLLWPLLVLLGLLPILPILIHGSPILNNDMLVAYFCYFWDFHKNWSWSQPLVFWSSSYQCGMPMHAYWQSGYLYPITWIFFGPLNPLYGIYLFYAFHFSLGIYGFLKLGPFLRLHKPAALWAGICFSLSGTMLARYEHTTFLSGWTWMPMVLATYLALRNKPGLKTLFLYAISVALQALGGHPQASITTAILIAAYTGIDIFRISKNPLVLTNPSKRKHLAWILGGPLLALLYCSPMLVPFLNLMNETSRFDGMAMEQGIDKDAKTGIHPNAILNANSSAAEKLESGVFGFEKFSTGGMRPLHLLSLVAPHFLGSPSNASWWGGEVWGEVFLYLGALGMFFCFFISWKRANLDMRILWIVGLLGLWIAFGKHLGASQILYHIPVLNNFRRPARFVILLVMAMAAGSGYGFQAWLANPRGRKFALWTLGASLFGASVFLWIRFFPGFTDSLLAYIGHFKKLDPSKDYGEKIVLLLGRGSVDFLFLALAGGTLFFVARKPRARYTLLFLVLLADLLRLHWDHFYLFSPEYYRKPPETAQVLDKASQPFWRVSHYLEYPGLELWNLHNDPIKNFALLEREKLALTFGIHAIFSYRHVGAHLPLIWNWEPGLTPGQKGARYLFTNTHLDFFRGDSLKSLGEFQGVQAYEIKDWKPRIEIVSSKVTEKIAPCDPGFSAYAGLCVDEKRDGALEIKGNFRSGDTLVFRERAYPGWQYSLANGVWNSVPKSNDHFVHIPIVQATNSIKLNFIPKDFFVLLSACILVTGLLPLSFFWIRKRKRKLPK